MSFTPEILHSMVTSMQSNMQTSMQTMMQEMAKSNRELISGLKVQHQEALKWQLRQVHQRAAGKLDSA